MTYRLEFHELALKEWRKLGPPLREQFKAKLPERLENPHVPASRLHGAAHRYKIKQRSSGYRLVYAVKDEVLVVQVIAVGRRNRNQAHTRAERR